ncbi:MAG: alpha-amylase family glycosyl hydrolase [Chitinophagaceae bacterium]
MPKPIDLLQSTRPQTLTEVRSLLDKARHDRIEYFPSPQDWRDEVLYFLLPDRFSDGKEHTRPLLTRQEIIDLRHTNSRPDMNWEKWAQSGRLWQGGNIKGIQGRLNYLKGLCVTTLWIAPVFKQRVRMDSYHGYGIQDFLEIDPRFGTRRELIELIDESHKKGLKIILDIIINHSGDNWGYVPPNETVDKARNEPEFRDFPDFYGNPNNAETSQWKIAWRNEMQTGFTTDGAQVSSIHDGVWPRELQDAAMYTRAGMGSLNDNDIGNQYAKHKRTDFFSLKDFALDGPGTLNFLADCFKYWIALTDCDGFRIDTVKHISLDETRNFCGAILEFSESIGKRNFFIVGEIAGGDGNQDFVLDNIGLLQRNLKAALDIGSDRVNLHSVGNGLARGRTYLESIKEDSEGFESHRSFGDRHVSILDDHDHVIGEKIRFSAEIADDAKVKDHHVVVPTALQLFTLGIPCIYYGTEQAFAGPAQSQLGFLKDHAWNANDNFADRYLREAMFGPEHPRAHFDSDIDTQLNNENTALPGFGAFGTMGKHCFDVNSPSYIRIAALCELRAAWIVLRTGRQYARQLRNFGLPFDYPAAGELVAWSRILGYQEAICIINPNRNDDGIRGGDVMVSSELWSAGTIFTVIANTAHVAATHAGQIYNGTHPVQSNLLVKTDAQGAAFIEIRDVSPGEVVVLVAG